jgi:hypothetical protein
MEARTGPPPTRHQLAFDECVSGFLKEMRRNREREALAFGIELAESGFEQHVWKRLMIFTAEDIGLAQPEVAVQVNALHDLAQKLKAIRKDDPARPWRLHLIQAVLLCCRARKSRICDNALLWLYMGEPVVPQIEDYHLDKHTTRGRRRGRGWKEFFETGSLLADQEGELGYGDLPDPYREDAIKVVSTLTQGFAETMAEWRAREDDR